MKLCVYCGTFNPIHNVHIAMANFVRTHYDFDSILFIPAYKPPHKNIDDELANHRFNMVKLAVSDIGGFSISNIEFRNNKFSYTFNTIEELYKTNPSIEGKINFIIGTDAFREVPEWYNANALKNMLKFIVFPREENFKVESLNPLKEAGYEFTIANMPYLNLSSTILRSRIRNHKPIGSLIPPKVLAYIEKNELYTGEKS